MTRRKRLLAIIAADALMLVGALLITLSITAQFAMIPAGGEIDPICCLGALLIAVGLYARAYVWAFG